MALIATPVVDAPGLTKDDHYTVLGFTGSTVLLLDDDQRLQHVPYSSLENPDVWTLSDSEHKTKKNKAKADK